MPLAEWVETHVVSPLTGGYHSTLRKAACSLTDPITPLSPSLRPHLDVLLPQNAELKSQLDTLTRLSDADAQIEIAGLLRAPHELFLAENEWAGAAFQARREREREEMESALVQRNAAEFLAYAIESHRQAELGAAVAGGGGAGAAGAPQTAAGDAMQVIDHALGAGADTIVEMDRRLRRDSKGESKAIDGAPEDADLRKMRLNLLAIAKRAPIDRIASLPAELVPPHIRHIVPTLGS